MASTLNVTEALKHPGQTYPFVADAVIEPFEQFGDPVALEDVMCEGELVAAGESIGLRAEAAATVRTRCARCTTEVVRPLRASIEAVYVHAPDPEDPDLYRYESSQIDLTDAIRDALILALPMRYLCREDCRGLCPKCGRDLNTGFCTCREDDDANPFAALRAIVENNEEV